MARISPGQCRAGRALLGWTQRDLVEKSGVAHRTLADFERGARAPYARTLKDIVEAFETAGLMILAPQEGVLGQGVAMKWGGEPALRQGGDHSSETDDLGPSVISGTRDPHFTALLQYWSDRPHEWSTLSEPLRRALIREIFGGASAFDPILENNAAEVHTGASNQDQG